MKRKVLGWYTALCLMNAGNKIKLVCIFCSHSQMDHNGMVQVCKDDRCWSCRCWPEKCLVSYQLMCVCVCVFCFFSFSIRSFQIPTFKIQFSHFDTLFFNNYSLPSFARATKWAQKWGYQFYKLISSMRPLSSPFMILVFSAFIVMNIVPQHLCVINIV